MSKADFKRYCKLDAALVNAGFPPTPDWWLKEIELFYTSATAMVWVACVGRGGFKSTAGTRLGLNEATSGRFKVPRGERHFFVFVSVNRDEAAQRLRLLEAYLKALGLGFHRTADTIEIGNSPIGFKVLTATVAANSGPRSIGAFDDELAKWQSADSAANPAPEVVASQGAMMVTHAKKARRFYFSSPVWIGDFHSKLVEQGKSDPSIFVSRAPSWIANPNAITEDDTRKLAGGDERIWRREYLAEPAAASSAAWSEELIQPAFKPRSDLGRCFGRWLVCDIASGGRTTQDRFPYGIFGWYEAPTASGRVLVFEHVAAFESADLRRLGGERVIAEICTVCARYGVTRGVGDQREEMLAVSTFARYGVRYKPLPWVGTNKVRGVARLTRWLVDGELSLPRHDRMLHEMRSFEEKFTSSGEPTYGARGSGHDDFVALLVTAAIADEARLLEGSPLMRRDGPSRDCGAVGARVASPFRQGNADGLDRISVDGSRTRVVVGRAPTFFSGRMGGF